MKARTVLGLIVVVLLIAVTAALFLAAGRDDSDPARYAAAEAIRAQTLQEQAWWEVSLPIRLVFYTGLVVIVLVGLALLVRVGYLYLRRRACTIYPDRNGVLPAVLMPWRDAAGRSGATLVDAGALAGPLVLGPAGPEYRLPADAVLALQGHANKGAALTRATRAWATQPAGNRAGAPACRVVGAALDEPPDLPPVEVLDGDEGHVYRLLEEGREQGGAP